MSAFIQQLQTLWRSPSPVRPLSLDKPLLYGCLGLMLLGLLMITSASTNIAAQEGSPYSFVLRQWVHLLVGMAAALFFLLVPLAFWQQRKVGWVALALVMLSLILLLLVAKPVNGAQRWFDFGLFKVQPAEISKLLVIIYLAGYLEHRQNHLRTRLRGLLIPLLCCLLPFAFFLYMQPDLGSIVLFFAVSGGMFFLAGINRIHLCLIAAPLTIALAFSLKPYHIERLLSAFNPWLDPFGTGFQPVQAQIAFGRGGWFGVGLGNSVQKQSYLPEVHTDFILAILGEELGFIGVLLCLALFALICLRALYIGVQAERKGFPFAAYLAYGIALLWMFQALVNFAVNLGFAPTKGWALPFVSYGGSALLVCCACLGLLLRIDWECRQLVAPQAAPQEDERLPDWLGELRHE